AEGGAARAVAEIDAIALDRAADVAGDGVAVALDEEPRAQGNMARIDGDDAIAGTHAQARAARGARPAASRSGVVGRRDHPEDPSSAEDAARREQAVPLELHHLGHRRLQHLPGDQLPADGNALAVSHSIAIAGAAWPPRPLDRRMAQEA